LPAGVVWMHFSHMDAHNNMRPSLLGCHELRVVDRYAVDWVSRLQDWALCDCSCFSDGCDDDLGMRQSRRRYPGSYMIDLLRDLGMKPRDRPRQRAMCQLPASLANCKQLCVQVWCTARD